MSKGTRRSKRKQEKNKIIAESLLNNEYQTNDIPADIKEIHLGLLSKQPSVSSFGNKKLEYSCKGCGRPDPPVKRYKKNNWIFCECCEGWWHLECACISKETVEKFNTYKIDYTCALCVLDVLPGLSVNRKRRYCTEFSSSDKGNSDAVTEPEEQLPKFVSVGLETELCESDPVPSHTLVYSTPEVKQCDSGHNCSHVKLNSTPSQSHSETIQSASETQPENSFLSPQSDFSPDQVIIVDNIENPKEFRSSIQIQEKIKRFEQFQEVQLAYSLPQGGIVLHFRSSVAAEKALENWPECVFNDKEVPHRTSSKKESKVNYMKNVDTSLSEFQIGEILSSIGIKYCSIKRLHYRYGRHPMPVVQLVHASVEDKLAALQMVIPITFQNRNAFLESKKFKVIRCFNCQRFGHIARTCIYSQRCECCGRTDHLGEVCGVCVQEFCCANCSGNHRSSSKNCPIYCHHASKFRASTIC